MGGHEAPSAEAVSKFQSYESIQYLVPNSVAYRKGARSKRPHPLSPGAQRWVMSAVIGWSTGVVAYLLKKLLMLLETARLEVLGELLSEHKLWHAVAWAVGSAAVLAAIAAVLTACFAPAAKSSGVPEVIAYLNGVTIRTAFNLRTGLCKFVSCAFAVASGLAAGPEGPMIHLGAILGRGLSQTESSALGLNFPRAFPALRNSKDLRDHVAVGAARGDGAAAERVRHAKLGSRWDPLGDHLSSMVSLEESGCVLLDARVIWLTRLQR